MIKCWYLKFDMVDDGYFANENAATVGNGGGLPDDLPNAPGCQVFDRPQTTGEGPISTRPAATTENDFSWSPSL